MKRRVTVIAIMCILMSIFSGSTIAYFSDEKQVSNSFTVGDISITLDESKVIESKDAYGLTVWVADTNSDRVEKNHYEKIYPGAILPKDPIITNVGTNPLTTKLFVTLTDYSTWKDELQKIGVDDIQDLFVDKDFVNWKIENNTVDKENNTITYCYNYNKILQSGEKTTPIFTNVAIPKKLGNSWALGLDYNFDIDLRAEATQIFN